MTTQVLLLDQPRSASHLLRRMLGEQSDVKYLDHPFSSTRWAQVNWLRSETYKEGMPEGNLSEWENGTQIAIEKWQQELTEAQKSNLKIMVQSHPFFPIHPKRLLEYIPLIESEQWGPAGGENITLIPDDLLLRPGTVPLFTIRDPRLAVPSANRTMAKMDLPQGGGRANYLITTSPIWFCVLYDFYLSHGIQPLVVEADDFITNENFVRQICSKAGLDPAQARLSWPAATEEELDKTHPMYYASQSTLITSTGANPAYAAKNVNFEAEEKKWAEEFGEDLPLVKEMIELAMPYYRYLWERRLKVEEA